MKAFNISYINPNSVYIHTLTRYNILKWMLKQYKMKCLLTAFYEEVEKDEISKKVISWKGKRPQSSERFCSTEGAYLVKKIVILWEQETRMCFVHASERGNHHTFVLLPPPGLKKVGLFMHALFCATAVQYVAERHVCKLLSSYFLLPSNNPFRTRRPIPNLYTKFIIPHQLTKHAWREGERGLEGVCGEVFHSA
jgi:hypothetical protein